MSVIALIPARAGSVRIPGKNMKPLAGHPLIAYTIAAAKQSGIFEAMVVSTDSDETAQYAVDHGAYVHERKPEHATSESPDIEWVRDFLTQGYWGDYFSILRPTSPFRTAATIQRAWKKFQNSDYDSLRAVEPVRQHPAKMWVVDHSVYGGLITPLIGDHIGSTPMHSCPTQILPKPYVQNASLEMARRRVVIESGSISGHRIGPFFTEGAEGFDLNTPDDWQFAEMKIASGEWQLPELK